MNASRNTAGRIHVQQHPALPKTYRGVNNVTDCFLCNFRHYWVQPSLRRRNIFVTGKLRIKMFSCRTRYVASRENVKFFTTSPETWELRNLDMEVKLGRREGPTWQWVIQLVRIAYLYEWPLEIKSDCGALYVLTMICSRSTTRALLLFLAENGSDV